MPTREITKKELEKGLKLLEILVANEIMNSKSEARRAIDNGGIKINDILVNNQNKDIQFSDFKNNTMKISFGKKKHYIFKII